MRLPWPTRKTLIQATNYPRVQLFQLAALLMFNKIAKLNQFLRCSLVVFIIGRHYCCLNCILAMALTLGKSLFFTTLLRFLFFLKIVLIFKKISFLKDNKTLYKFIKLIKVYLRILE